MIKGVAFVALAAGLMSGATAAETLKIGIAADPITLDPHVRSSTNEVAMLRLLYEPLTWVDKNQEAQSVLAKTWRRIGPLTWQFELRDIAQFSDGTPVTARDVIYSFCRVKAQGAGPESFAPYIAGITSIEASNTREITFKTVEPDAALPVSIATIAVLQATNLTGEPKFTAAGCQGIASYPTRAEFDAGQMPLGSGTHRLQSRTPGKQLMLNRVNDYWAGVKTRWDVLDFEVIPDPAARVAALLTKVVAVVSDLPTESLPMLKYEGSFSYSLVPTNGRLVHVQFNHAAKSRTGDAPNPFVDVRVRQAPALALDRPQLIAGLSLGMGQAADNIVPPNFDEGVVRWRQLYFYGPLNDASETGPDPSGAKHLLAEAGFASGIKTTLAAPDRFHDVAKLVVAQLKTVGIDATLVPLSAAATADLRLGDFPGWTGELSAPLKALAFRPDAAKGLGVDNWGGYSSPAIEDALEGASAVEDDQKRRRAMRQVEQMLLKDAALVPVMYVNDSWGQYQGIAFDSRMTQRSIFAQHLVTCVPCHDLNP